MLKTLKTFLVLALTLGALTQAHAQSTQEESLQNSDVTSGTVNSNEAPSLSVDPQNENERQPFPLYWETVGEVGTQKFLVQRFDFRPSNYRDLVHAFRVVGTRTSVNISQAEVELANGLILPVQNFHGILYEGQSAVVRISRRGEYVRAIRIWATSGNLFGARGRFRVDLAVER